MYRIFKTKKICIFDNNLAGIKTRINCNVRNRQHAQKVINQLMQSSQMGYLKQISPCEYHTINDLFYDLINQQLKFNNKLPLSAKPLSHAYREFTKSRQNDTLIIKAELISETITF